ncbi:hypothetical protein ACHWQZ_G004556 [Mnemiopsis leidyi]
MSGIFIVAAKRTPFGKFGGSLKKKSITDLSEIALKAALTQAGLDPEHISSTVIGNVCPVTSKEGIYSARHVALRCGVPKERPAYMINRLCGSGFQSVVNAAQEIKLGESDIVAAGGAENMSQYPYVIRDARFGIPFGTVPPLEDSLWGGLEDQHVKMPMAITAENLAELHGISRDECDQYAMQSQQRWGAAQQSGRFTEEIAPVAMKTKKGVVELSVDEHPRPDVTPAGMAKLPPVFKKNGTVTAANASGICDGAGMIIVASEEACTKHNLTPLARLVNYSVAGVCPTVMGRGPTPAINQVLEKSGLSLSDIGLVDVNEAFAAQFLAVSKELGLDNDKTNVNGGAIALGHPLAASGSRITANLMYEMRHRGVRYGIGSACIGGGQGIALLLEKC